MIKVRVIQNKLENNVCSVPVCKIVNVQYDLLKNVFLLIL